MERFDKWADQYRNAGTQVELPKPKRELAVESEDLDVQIDKLERLKEYLEDLRETSKNREKIVEKVRKTIGPVLQPFLEEQQEEHRQSVKLLTDQNLKLVKTLDEVLKTVAEQNSDVDMLEKILGTVSQMQQLLEESIRKDQDLRTMERMALEKLNDVLDKY